MKKNILVLGGGILQLPLIKEINKAGQQAIVMDKDPEALGFKVDSVIKILGDISNTAAAVKKALKLNQQYKISAVITVGTDFTYTVNRIKKSLGLNCLSEKHSLIFSHKGKLREFLTAHKFPQPKFIVLKNRLEIEKVFLNLLFPLVVKPVDSMGARGVVRIEKHNQTLFELKDRIIEAYKKAKKVSLRGEVIIEEFIRGQEFSLDALIVGGAVIITGLADRVIEFPPYFVETGHIIPSLQKPTVQNKIKKNFIAAVKSLNLKEGAVKGDVFLDQNNRVIIGELAYRLSGGFMSTHTFPLSSGINLMRAIIDLNLMEKPNLKKIKNNQPNHPKPQVVEKSIFLFEPSKPSKDSRSRILKNNSLNNPLAKAFTHPTSLATTRDNLAITINSIRGIKHLKKIKEIKNIYFYKKIGDKVYYPKNNLMKIASLIIASTNIDGINRIIKLIKRKLKINNSTIYFPLIDLNQLAQKKNRE